MDRVCRFANVLKARSVKKGDRVALYCPWFRNWLWRSSPVPALVRCAVWSSPVFRPRPRGPHPGRWCRLRHHQRRHEALRQGLAQSRRRSALAECPTVTTNLVVRHTGESVDWTEGRDVWLHDALNTASADCTPERMAAEDLLFILYTSGSTGKPKGVVHTCGGYMVYAGYSFANVFQYQPGDVYWCTADIGWITGHSYIVYGPMLNGATTVMFEGVPT